MDFSNYDDLPELNGWLDERHEESHGGPVVVFDKSFNASEVLFSLSPVTYESAYQDYLLDKVYQIKERVFSDYPSPIAYHFYRFEHGYEDQTQRLHFLRSTWESLINIIHAIVVSEERYRELPLEESEVKMSDLLTDSLAKRLQNIQYILSYVDENSFEFNAKDVVPEEAIKKMANLNRTRNAFSHSDAISSEQAADYIKNCVDDVVAVLDMLDKLKDVFLMRYLNQSGLTIRYEAFDGHAMTKTIKNQKISQEKLAKSISSFDQSQIIVQLGDDIFSLKPFLHYKSTAGGHETRICYLKKCHGSGQDRYLKFETIGESQENDEIRSMFQHSINPSYS